MFNLLASNTPTETTANQIPWTIENIGWFFTKHQCGDKVIITSGLYVFLVIAALLCFIIMGLGLQTYMIKLFGSISILLIIIILCNLSTYWQYINQTTYMLIINIIVLVVLLFVFICALLEIYKSNDIQNILIPFIIICIIFVIIAVMYSYIPQSDSYNWFVFNSQMITIIIFSILLIVAAYVNGFMIYLEEQDRARAQKQISILNHK